MVLLRDQKELENGIVQNLSEGGVFFVSSSKLEVGDPTKIVFVIPESNSPEMEIEGRVIYRSNHSKAGVGIKFRSLSEKNREIIRNYVD